MIDDYGEIKKIKIKNGESYYMCVVLCTYYIHVPTREKVWWRVEMGVE